MTTTRSQMKVPFVDLQLQNDQIADEAGAAIAEVCASGSFVLGPQVQAFEEAYARFCGVGHCVGVANGTDAIELALRAAEVGHGDEVIVPTNTFYATGEAVLRAGAELVLVDCDEDFLIDVDRVAEATTNRTRAVIGVDLYGQVAPFERLDSAVGDDVVLVEDAAQSQGARRGGQPAGSFGAVAAVSFYPGKNLGAFGDAGAVTTDNEAIARRVRTLRNHGGINRYEHDLIGTNSRLDSIQAAVLSVKLGRLADWNADRVAAAERYRNLLADLDGVVTPRTLPTNDHVWHLYVVRVADRDQVVQRLGEAGVATGLHYPRPLHRLPALAGRYRPDAYPVADRLAAELVSLPMFPGITERQQEHVAWALGEAVAGR